MDGRLGLPAQLDEEMVMDVAVAKIENLGMPSHTSIATFKIGQGSAQSNTVQERSCAGTIGA